MANKQVSETADSTSIKRAQRFNEKMNKVKHYLEQHLDDNPTLQQLAAISCYSEFHFQRLFHAFVGQSLHAYKKRLLLERAVKQLRFSQSTITEIAFQCGFQTQTSFNKAFKAQFQHTPSHVRLQKQIFIESQLQPYEKRSFTMQVSIQQLNDIEVICARATGDYAQAAEQAWQTIMPFAYGNKLMKDDTRAFGICHDDPNVTESALIRYDACLDIDGDISNSPELQKIIIAGGKYAVFLHQGAYENLQQTYSQIYNDWLVNSEFELRDQPCFEVYLNRDPRHTKPENLKTEIYIPLK